MNRSGFTLLETLIVLVVGATLITSAYQILDIVLKYESRAMTKESEEIEIALSIIRQDLLHIRHRIYRDAQGDIVAPFVYQDGELSLTRGGLPPIQGYSSAGLQQVRYALVDSQLIRRHAPVIDLDPGSQFTQHSLSSNVATISFRFYTETLEKAVTWPPAQWDLDLKNNKYSWSGLIPSGIEVTIRDLNGRTFDLFVPGVGF